MDGRRRGRPEFLCYFMQESVLFMPHVSIRWRLPHVRVTQPVVASVCGRLRRGRCRKCFSIPSVFNTGVRSEMGALQRINQSIKRKEGSDVALAILSASSTFSRRYCRGRNQLALSHAIDGSIEPVRSMQHLRWGVSGNVCSDNSLC